VAGQVQVFSLLLRACGFQFDNGGI